MIIFSRAFGYKLAQNTTNSSFHEFPIDSLGDGALTVNSHSKSWLNLHLNHKIGEFHVMFSFSWCDIGTNFSFCKNNGDNIVSTHSLHEKEQGQA